MSKALQIRNGKLVGAVDLYRDGDVVTMVARGGAVRTNPYGTVRTSADVTNQYSSVEAYEYERDKVFQRWPLAYVRLIGRLGIDDDARNAPPLPSELRHLLPDGSSTTTAGDRPLRRLLLPALGRTS
jgi:hypothetical protein